MRYLILFLLLVLPGIASIKAEPVVQPRTLVVLGDSLSAAFRIPAESGWVALLEKRLMQQESRRQYYIVNASISGETTAGGLARLPKLLADHAPALVLVELGANDGLRGLAVEEIRANLQRILKASRDAGAKIVLIGIELPLNYGPQYRDGLRNMYRDVAHEFNVPLVPFLLEGVATDPTLMQDDGMHPLAAAEPRVLETVWPVLEPVLKALR